MPILLNETILIDQQINGQRRGKVKRIPRHLLASVPVTFHLLEKVPSPSREGLVRGGHLREAEFPLGPVFFQNAVDFRAVQHL